MNKEIINELNTLRSKSICSKLKVSAIVKDKNGDTIGEGINNSKDIKDCVNEIVNTENGSTSGDNIIHAEPCCINSIKKGTDVSEAIFYCSHSPCIVCAEKIYNAGFKTVKYLTAFKNFSGIKYMMDHGITVTEISEDIYANGKIALTPDFTILKKIDTQVKNNSGLIVETNTANSVEEIVEVVASVKYKKGDTLLVQMQGALWLDNEMKYFLVKNEDILLEITKNDNFK